MTKLEELKSAYDDAYADAYDAWDAADAADDAYAAYFEAYAAADASWDAYQTELEKQKELTK